jgi:hypothetical protein
MKPGSLRTAAATLLRRLFGSSASGDETETFLRTRNVRLIVQDAEERSFHATRLNPSQDIHAFGRKFHMELRIVDDRVYVKVVDKENQATLADVSVPYTDEVGTLYLNIDDVRLRIEADAAPTTKL